jgi:phosphoribosyl 1,2-cyclic phosphodiesterase
MHGMHNIVCHAFFFPYPIIEVFQMAITAVSHREKSAAGGKHITDVNNPQRLRGNSMEINDGSYTAIVRSGKSNSSIIMDKANLILVDCGAGPKVLEKSLSDINMTIERITGAVITHSHSDHMNEATLRKLAANGVPIYCNDEVKKIAVAATKEEFKQLVMNHIHAISVRTEFNIGNYTIKAFNLKHDAEGGCYGYVFKKKMPDKIEKILYATDFGYPSDHIKELFRNSDVIFIESDHDDGMLDKNVGIPEYIKEDHIRNNHISNAQCSAMLEEILSNSDNLPRKIHLLHITDTINTDDKAISTCRRMLIKNGWKDIVVSI